MKNRVRLLSEEERAAIVKNRPFPELYLEEEFNNRPKYIGKGKIVGWGTDKEPLIEVVSIDES